jgi:hypothetical protein
MKGLCWFGIRFFPVSGARRGLIAALAIAASAWPVGAGAQTVSEFPITANSNPVGITAGPDGALWFTEQGTNKIGRITTAGMITEFSTLTANSGPFGITAGPDGALWFTGLAAHHEPAGYWDVIGRANPRKGGVALRRASRRRKTATGMREDASAGAQTEGQNQASNVRRQLDIDEPGTTQ